MKPLFPMIMLIFILSLVNQRAIAIPMNPCASALAKVWYFFAVKFTERGKQYASARQQLLERRIERDDRKWSEIREGLMAALREYAHQQADLFREAVQIRAAAMRERAATDVAAIIFSNAIMSEVRNPNDRPYDWIFEGFIEDTLGRMRQNPGLTIVQAFPRYTVDDYLRSDVVKPEINVHSKTGNLALKEFQERLLRHKALNEGEVKLLVSRDHSGWAYLKFGPLSGEQARWVAHVWGSAEIDGVLFQANSRCTEIACDDLIEANHLTELTTIDKLRRIQAKHLEKPQINETTGEVEFLDDVAGRFSYITLGMMGYFKNEPRRVIIPQRLRAGSLPPTPSESQTGDVLIIRDEPEIRFLN